MKRIIISMPNFIGDSINTIPAIELIRQAFPQAQITLLGPSFLKELFKYDPRISCIIVSDKRKKCYFKNVFVILKGRYDLGVLFTNTFMTALMFRLAFVKRCIGYKNESRGFLLNFKPRLNRNVHYINRYAMLVNAYLGNKFTYLPPLKLYYNQESKFHFVNGNPVVGLYLGGTNKKFRRYPEEQAIVLLKMLRNYNLVLIGDSNDAVMQSSYVRQAGIDNVLDLSGKTSVGELVTSIVNMDLLITIDSAAMHIAAAVETAFIALLGLSTSPTSAILPKTQVGVFLKIENNLINEADYIKNITPEIIYQNVRLLLNKRKGRNDVQ